MGGWVQVSLEKKNNWNIVPNSHIVVLVFWGLYILLEVVSHYDLSRMS